LPHSPSSTLASVLAGLCLVLSPASADALLINGDFDAGPGPEWSQSSPGGLIVDPAGGLPVTPYSGTYSAWLGGATNTFHRLSQLVAVPADMTLNALDLQLWIATSEIGLVEYDTLVVNLEDPGGAVLETLGSWSNVDETIGWTPVNLGVSGSYSGQSVRLVIEAENDISSPTSFFVDSMAFVLPEPAAMVQHCAGVLALLAMAAARRRTVARATK